MQEISVVGIENSMLASGVKRYWQPLIDALTREFELTEELNGSGLIAINHNLLKLKKYKQLNPAGKTVLIRTEPPSVYPKQYSVDVESMYDMVLTPGGDASLQQEPLTLYPYFYFQNPHYHNSSDPSITEVITSNNLKALYDIKNWRNRNFEISLIAANKLSAMRDSNYDIRRELVINSEIRGLKIYGHNWNSSLSSRIKVIIGLSKFCIINRQRISAISIVSFLRPAKKIIKSVENKHQIIESSKFTLIIENSSNFLTEKLFDAFIAGSIPIYVGPKLSAYGIPNDLVIEVSPSINELKKTFNSLISLDEEKYLRNIYKFVLSRDGLRRFDGTEIYARVVKETKVLFDS